MLFRNVRGGPPLGSGRAFGLCSEAAVEALALIGHLAQQVGGRETVPIGLGQLIAAFGGIGCAKHVEPAERAAGPGGEIGTASCREGV